MNNKPSKNPNTSLLKYLPEDTEKIVKSFNSLDKYENFHYIFNKPYIKLDSRNNLPVKIKLDEKIKSYKWKEGFLRSIIIRQNNYVKSLQNVGYMVETFNAKSEWRLVIGLGAAHPQETSMTLHHIYGFPYIPASAIKGITRHWAIIKFAQNYKNESNNIFDSIERIAKSLEKGQDLQITSDNITFSDLIQIFGTNEQVGKVIFVDAYPVDAVNLKLDIMNVHYPDYYSGNKPPADWQSPNPIMFLTVEETKFAFILASKNKEYLQKASKLLKEALQNHGLGAKTSLGYGRFAIDSDKTNKV